MVIAAWATRTVVFFCSLCWRPAHLALGVSSIWGKISLLWSCRGPGMSGKGVDLWWIGSGNEGRKFEKAEGYDLHGFPCLWPGSEAGAEACPLSLLKLSWAYTPIQSSVLTRGSQIYSGFETRPGDEWWPQTFILCHSHTYTSWQPN